jgi:hypothetical protein
MKKLIISLLFTLTPFQVALAQGTEITDTFSSTELTQLKQNICNSQVNGILSTNQPDETHPNDPLLSSGQYTTNSYGGDDDDDDEEEGYNSSSNDSTIVAVYSAENTVDSICP